MKKPKRTVSPPTGEVASEFQLRVCGQHDYPVGLISGTSREQFICLSNFHRMDIEQTKTRPTNMQMLPKLVKVLR